MSRVAQVKYQRTFDGVRDVEIPAIGVGDRLRIARRWRGVGRVELAEHLGITERTLSRYENGKSTPARSLLSLAALRLGVPVFWLADIDPGEDPWRLPGLPDGTSYEPADDRQMVVLEFGVEEPPPAIDELSARRRFKQSNPSHDLPTNQ